MPTNAEQIKTSRLVAMDALKGISIIGVVCIHAKFSSRLDERALAFIATLKTFFSWSVLAFFFAAGFVRFSRERKTPMREFIRRRALQLLVPCLILSVVNRSALEVLSGMGLARLVEERAISDWLLPVPPQFYFLPVLFVLSVALEAISRLLPSRTLVAVAITTLLAALMAVYVDVQVAHGPALSLLPLYFVAYCSGATCGLMACLRRWQTRKMIGVLGGLVVALALLTMRYNQLGWLIIPPVLSLLFWCGRDSGVSTALAWLGRRSGAVYLWHAPLLMPAVCLLIVRAGLNGVTAAVLILALSILFSLLVGTTVAKHDRWNLASL